VVRRRFPSPHCSPIGCGPQDGGAGAGGASRSPRRQAPRRGHAPAPPARSLRRNHHPTAGALPGLDGGAPARRITSAGFPGRLHDRERAVARRAAQAPAAPSRALRNRSWGAGTNGLLAVRDRLHRRGAPPRACFQLCVGLLAPPVSALRGVGGLAHHPAGTCARL
jgi:hypothetical protein